MEKSQNYADYAWEKFSRNVQKADLNEQTRLRSRMAEHAANNYSAMEREYTTAEFRNRLTGRDE